MESSCIHKLSRINPTDRLLLPNCLLAVTDQYILINVKVYVFDKAAIFSHYNNFGILWVPPPFSPQILSFVT